MARLIITEADGGERSVVLPARSVRIGRSTDNDVVLPDAGKGVSRAHAELRFEHGRYILVDLQSQNGTWVNGTRIQREPVPPGADIAIGLYRLRLEPGPAASEAAAGGASGETPPARNESPAAEASASNAAGERAAAKPPLAKWLLFAGGVVVGMTVLIVGRVMTSPVAQTPAPAGAQPGAGTPTGVSPPPAQPAPPSADPTSSTLPPEDRSGSGSGQQAVVNVRAEAQRLLDAGVKLDAAGDWLEALRKFEQARALDAGLPGLAGAETQVRVRLREAGLDALKRARSYDAAGRTSDALREYERAAQWLPSTDPDQQAARARAGQLRGGAR